MSSSYRITREVHADHDPIIFEFDRDSAQELFRDFPHLEHLHAHAFRYQQLAGVAYRRLWSGLRPGASGR